MTPVKTKRATRERILDACLKLFNERGVASVSSADMSEAIGISQGNIAYHFPRKSDLILALFAEREAHIAALFKRMKEHYLREREQPFGVLFDQLTELFGIVRQYRFVSIDLAFLARRYPEIGVAWTRENRTMARVAERLFSLAVADGYMEPESRPGAFDRHIHRMQILLNFYVLDEAARGDGSSYVVLLFEDLMHLLSPAGKQMVGAWLPMLGPQNQ